MEESRILKFKDEDGNVVELEAVAEIYLEKQKYLILAYRVDADQDGNEELNAIDSDEEFMAVKKEYKNLLYGEGGRDE